MSDLVTRLLSGTVFLAVMILAIIYGPDITLVAFGVIALVGLWEFYGLQLHPISTFKRICGMIMAMDLFYMLWSGHNYYAEMLFCWAVVLLLSTLVKKERTGIESWGAVLYGQIYVVLPFLLLFLLGIEGDYNYQAILSVFIILWCSDSGAYMIGKFLGKHKMIPSISPNKTWEGLFGGVLSAVLAAYVLHSLSWELVDLPWYVLGIVIALFGAGGDLYQSQLKRLKGVKDSGNIMPGHGGILDRFDGLLLSVPVIFALLKMLEK